MAARPSATPNGRKNTQFAEDGEVLSKILEDPTWACRASGRRPVAYARVGPDAGLDFLSNAELGHAVSYPVAEEMRQSTESKPYVMFVDAYEVMVPTPLPGAAGRNIATRFCRGAHAA